MRTLILLLTLLAYPAVAQETEIWDVAGDWTVRIKSDDATRCYASRSLPDGSQVEIGTEPTLDGGYFAIYNPKWTDIRDGAAGTVEFDFGRSRFGGEAVGRIKDGVPGGYVFFNNPAFVQEFSRRLSVNIIGKNAAEFEFDLTGTSRAIRTVLACQDAQPDPE